MDKKENRTKDFDEKQRLVILPFANKQGLSVDSYVAMQAGIYRLLFLLQHGVFQKTFRKPSDLYSFGVRIQEKVVEPIHVGSFHWGNQMVFLFEDDTCYLHDNEGVQEVWRGDGLRVHLTVSWTDYPPHIVSFISNYLKGGRYNA